MIPNKNSDLDLYTDLSKYYDDDDIYGTFNCVVQLLDQSGIKYEKLLNVRYIKIDYDEGVKKRIGISFRYDHDNNSVISMEYLKEIQEDATFPRWEVVINKKVTNLNDIIEFISEHIPGVISTNVLKQVNENMDNEKEVIKKFLLHVSGLDQWHETNMGFYKGQYDGDDMHYYSLYENDNIVLKRNSYNKEALSIDDSIEYFTLGFYSDSETTHIEFHVYEAGEFREATIKEDDYFRELDDEEHLGFGFIEQITYEDWIKSKEDTIKLFKQINENTIIKDFNNFKLIYNKRNK